MPKFNYQGIDASGDPVTGELQADSRRSVARMLMERGYIPTIIEQKGGLYLRDRVWKPDFQRLMNPIKPRDLILFTKQLRTLVKANVPMLDILKILEEQTENLYFRNIVKSISRSIKEEGRTLYYAFEKHPHVFSQLYCSIVQAGERSGALESVLDRLTYILEHEYQMRSDFKAALRYPLFVLFFLGISFFVLLFFVIPKFVAIFTARGLSLPLPTRVTIFVYDFIIGYWPFILVAGGLFLFAIAISANSRRGKFMLDSFIIRLPIAGPLVIKMAMARFSSIFSVLQYSGVRVLESFSILAGTMGNSVIATEFERFKREIEHGKSIASQLAATRYFPPLVVNMIAVGEKTERLDEMLLDVSKHYDEEVEYAIKELNESIGPLLTIGMAFVIGFFALAIFLPIWEMSKMGR